MNSVTVHPDKVLIRISEEERRKLFEKDIKTNDGSIISLVTGIKQDEGFDEAYAQSLDVGVVIGVGSNVPFAKVGDVAILDYTVDVSPELIAYIESDSSKVVCIDGVAKYHEEELVLFPNRNRHFNQYVYKKGDLDKTSSLIGVIRDGVIIPNFPYTFLETKEESNNFEKRGLLYTMSQDRSICTNRKIVNVCEGSELETGQVVIVEKESIFNRKINGSILSVVYEHDILAIVSG